MLIRCIRLDLACDDVCVATGNVLSHQTTFMVDRILAGSGGRIMGIIGSSRMPLWYSESAIL